MPAATLLADHRASAATGTATASVPYVNRLQCAYSNHFRDSSSPSSSGCRGHRAVGNRAPGGKSLQRGTSLPVTRLGAQPLPHASVPAAPAVVGDLLVAGRRCEQSRRPLLPRVAAYRLPCSPSAPTKHTDESKLITQGAALTKGSMTRIRGVQMTILDELGKGSFGTVWSAIADSGHDIAIKELSCSSEREMAEAVHEAKILEMISQNRRRSSSSTLRLPTFIGLEIERGSGCHCRVRLAMTRVSGQPLDKFLSCRPSLWRSSGPSTWGRKTQLAWLGEATSFAREVIVQLSSTFEKSLASDLVHRDATARNILVDVSKGITQPVFGLVDFGLAVRTASWGGPLGDWRYIGVSGDGRYWPTSAWLIFELESASKLARCTELCAEYQHHLDLHSVGLTALQALVELSPPCEDLALHSDQILLAMRTLRGAWEKYWNDVSRYWRGIFDTMRKQGKPHLQQLRQSYAKAEVHQCVQQGLLSLRSAIRGLHTALLASAVSEAGAVLTGKAQGGKSTNFSTSSAATVLEALLLLISGGESPYKEVNWKTVRRTVDGITRPSLSSPLASTGSGSGATGEILSASSQGADSPSPVKPKKLRTPKRRPSTPSTLLESSAPSSSSSALASSKGSFAAPDATAATLHAVAEALLRSERGEDPTPRLKPWGASSADAR